MKLLFQGDSITDAKRNRSDIHDLGQGYPLYAAEEMKRLYPDQDFEFINLAYSGNHTLELVERLERDFIAVDPDIVSILIGINDVWTSYKHNRPIIPDAVFEDRYRQILSALKTRTHAKIMLLEPFLGPVENKVLMRWDLDNKIQIVRRLAREYADHYIPTDGLLAQAYVREDFLKFAADGVHPTPYGAEFLGKLYAREIKALL